MMQGFDIVAGSQLASLPAFQKQFGILQPSGSYLVPAHYISAWSSIAPACEVVATFAFVPLLERFGRKPGILVAMMISVAGVLLQQLATDWRTHLAGRGVNGEQISSETILILTTLGIAIGMMFTISPLWIGETCRPELRGFFLCFFNTSIVFGQFAMSVFLSFALILCLSLLLNLCKVSLSQKEEVISMENGECRAPVCPRVSLTCYYRQWWLPVVAMYIFPRTYKIGHAVNIINNLGSHTYHRMVLLPRIPILANKIRKINPSKERIEESLRLQRRYFLQHRNSKNRRRNPHSNRDPKRIRHTQTHFLWNQPVSGGRML